MLQDPPVRKLDAKVLCSYSGTYELSADIQGTIRCENDELIFERPARPAGHFRSELLDVLFEPGEFSLKTELGFAFPLNTPQSTLFQLGGSESLKALWALSRYFDLGPSATYLHRRRCHPRRVKSSTTM